MKGTALNVSSVEERGELLRCESPVALGYELTDLVPVGVVGEPSSDAVATGARGEERVADGQQRIAFIWSGTQHEQRNGDSSTRTVNSGSARHSVLTRWNMSCGISTGEPARALSAVLLTSNILLAREGRISIAPRRVSSDVSVGSGRVRRWVEQGQLGSIGSLEHAEPLVEVGAADRVAAPRRLEVPRLDSSPELVGRHVEIVQLDADSKAASHQSHLVTFAPRPEPEIEDDAQAEAQDVLRETPELVINLLPGRRVPRVGAERDEPVILREA
jgi:hypothetical protein